MVNNYETLECSHASTFIDSVRYNASVVEISIIDPFNESNCLTDFVSFAFSITRKLCHI